MNKSSISPGFWNWRRLLQFRLRGVLIAITLCALAFTWARHRLESYRRQHEIFAAISSRAIYIGTIPGSPAWLRPFADSTTFSDIGHLSFQGQHPFTDAEMETLSHLPRLHRLSLHGTRITNAGLKHLSNLQELDTLSLKSTEISDEGLVHLSGLQNLTTLQLSNSKVSRRGAKALSELRGLEVLELGDVQLEDDDIRRLAQLPRLRSLEMSPGKLTLQGFAYLSTIQSLKVLTLVAPLPQQLDLRGLSQLSNISIHSNYLLPPLHFSFVDLPRLSRLNLSVTRIDGLLLRNLPQLGHFWLNRVDIHQNVLPQLAHLSQLTDLSLATSQFDPAELQHLKVLPRLKELDLDGTGIRDDDLQYIGELRTLERLHLSGHRIRGPGIVHLVSLPHLKYLDMSLHRMMRNGWQLIRKSNVEQEEFSSQAAFSFLCQMTTLEELWLLGVPMVKHEILMLTRLTNLKNLQIDTNQLNALDLVEVSSVLPLLNPPPRISR